MCWWCRCGSTQKSVQPHHSAQRNVDPQEGAIISNGMLPALEIATVLGTEVPARAAFSEVQGLLPCMSRGTELHSNVWALVPTQKVACRNVNM
ncbi:unnamed protein product [Staurois parvus]|uniref:Uncharacterized protein n=1 Tax=Staurois parvus TaxID=386267 RepID=A0ABN9F2X5_9NEOB|nr:unnamed protein product [Staurois parvus]